MDFHALRHTYITNVVNSPASVKVMQELARHSDPKLTIGRYAHTRLSDSARLSMRCRRWIILIRTLKQPQCERRALMTCHSAIVTTSAQLGGGSGRQGLAISSTNDPHAGDSCGRTKPLQFKAEGDARQAVATGGESADSWIRTNDLGLMNPSL